VTTPASAASSAARPANASDGLPDSARSTHTSWKPNAPRPTPSDFITATPWTHLKDLPRYLRGILKRLEKLPAAEQRDARGMAGVLTLQNKFLARLQQAMQGSGVDAALAEFRWQLEELRISLFAQELKTPYPVSVKRLEKLWDELCRKA
jgi:ATP-dependent helicase HrpA